MRTPICEFVREYAEGHSVRMHMPAHKGQGELSEMLDITEISGADSLFEASGIIAESEKNAGSIFGARTFYSTEGSSLCIRTMVHLITLLAASRGERPLILAGRNAHKSFISGAMLTGCDVEWMYGTGGSYLSCNISADDIKARLTRLPRPTAVYITAPDYLGHIVDIEKIAKACRDEGVLLAVDNAHGAYLKFLEPSRHPIDLGAHICSDSAHKTLHALTGAAYLHVAHDAPSILHECAKNSMSLFASTSPSYLILQSLDRLNSELSGNYSHILTTFIDKIEQFKQKLKNSGYTLVDGEPMKITICAADYGYLGTELGAILSNSGVECEFCDRDYIVLMPSPDNTDADMARACAVLCGIPKREKIDVAAPTAVKCERVLSLREASLSPYEYVPVEESVGRILAAVTVGCPPAVPIVVPGEKINGNAVQAMLCYGTERVAVIKNNINLP